MADIKTLISVHEFSFSYADSDTLQLHNVSFKVKRGQKVAIMGATGAGKTTLAMAFNGIVPHHHDGEFNGRFSVDGKEVMTTDISTLVRQVGLVMQDPEAQITGRTVLEDAAIGPANLGLPREDVYRRAERALHQVGMAEFKERDTSHLSGGQKQRLAIAGILAMQPEIIVLDEPTSELDPAATEQIFDLINDIATAENRTVILIEHEPELVHKWADKLLVLQQGNIVFDGAPEEFFQKRAQVDAARLRQPGVFTALEYLKEISAISPDAVSAPFDVNNVAHQLKPLITVKHTKVPAPYRAPATESVIEVHNLVHEYPSGVRALNSVSVEIKRGEFVALLGRNGAGKTTFARHLNGLLRPTSGSVRICGNDTSGKQLHELATQVGYVFQNPDHQIFAPTVGEEIAFGLINLGLDAAEIDDRIDSVLKQVDMVEARGLHPYRLGRGERQRLAVASVLALEPNILVIDEPTTGQDWHGSLAIMELVKALNESGHTVIMITHDMLLASMFASRTLVFEDGILRADCAVTELVGDLPLLRETHLRPPQITELGLALGIGPIGEVTDFEQHCEFNHVS